MHAAESTNSTKVSFKNETPNDIILYIQVNHHEESEEELIRRHRHHHNSREKTVFYYDDKCTIPVLPTSLDPLLFAFKTDAFENSFHRDMHIDLYIPRKSNASFVAWPVSALAKESVPSSPEGFPCSKWPLRGISGLQCKIGDSKIEILGDYTEGASYIIAVAAEMYGRAPVWRRYGPPSRGHVPVAPVPIDKIYGPEMPVLSSDKYNTPNTVPLPTASDIPYPVFSPRVLAAGVVDGANGYNPEIPYHQYLSRMFYANDAAKTTPELKYTKWVEENFCQTTRVASRPFANYTLKIEDVTGMNGVIGVVSDPYASVFGITGDTRPVIPRPPGPTGAFGDLSYLLQPMNSVLAELYSCGAAELNPPGEEPGYTLSSSSSRPSWWSSDRSKWVSQTPTTTSFLRSPNHRDHLKVHFSCFDFLMPQTSDHIQRSPTRWVCDQGAVLEAVCHVQKRCCNRWWCPFPNACKTHIAITIAMVVMMFTVLCLVIFALIRAVWASGSAVSRAIIIQSATTD